MFKKIKDAFKETGLIQELCEYLRQIGINATMLESGSPEAVGSKWQRGPLASGLVLGNVKIEGQNINLVQVERTQTIYRYDYVVQANIEGLEKNLEAKGEPKKKGFFSKEVVDYKWEGKDLAKLLNGDSDLKNMLLREQLGKIEVKADKKRQCVWITPEVKTPTRVSIGGIPVKGGLTAGRKAFPTREDFEAYDRIAKHIRNITRA